MSEPRAVAPRAEEVVPGVWHWRIRDERIGGNWAAAHGVATAAGTVLVDPLPLADDAAEPLGDPVAIVLTASVHQRSAWRLRRELGVPVWVPAATREADEEPDGRYGEGDDLPGGLRAVFTPGGGTTQHSLLFDRVLFTPDLFVRPPDAPLAFVPSAFVADPGEARRSAERLLELDFDVLCTAHGAPVTEGAKAAIRALLESG